MPVVECMGQTKAQMMMAFISNSLSLMLVKTDETWMVESMGMPDQGCEMQEHSEASNAGVFATCCDCECGDFGANKTFRIFAMTRNSPREAANDPFCI
jgi:hypothetical protein